jgi:hypothetical protein
MNNNEFMEKEDQEKRSKLLRVLNARLPEASVEDLIKVVSALNLKRQYNIKVIPKKEHLAHLATAETIKRNEDIDGISWESSTISNITVIMGNIVPGKYENINGVESYVDTEISFNEGLYAFIKENHNLGYTDLSKPEYENFLCLYFNK